MARFLAQLGGNFATEIKNNIIIRKEVAKMLELLGIIILVYALVKIASKGAGAGFSFNRHHRHRD